jgi:(p)ppGpp synthase/HD superfamily hydrolase
MKDTERRKLLEAVAFALEAHAEQTRKGTRIPYASHLLQVVGLVFEHGGDVDQAVAAVLHDTIEDCEHVEVEQIHLRFGDDVARMVTLCTDLLPGDRPGAKSDWSQRKSGFVERLRRADARAQLVAACDKLHNLRTLVADLHAEGAETLERFTATPAQTRWYHETVREAVAPSAPPRLLREFDALLESLREFVGEARPDDGSRSENG